MKNLLEQLSKNLGYDVPEKLGIDTYFRLMALQVGALDHRETKNRLKLLENIVILAEICEIIIRSWHSKSFLIAAEQNPQERNNSEN